MELLKEYFIKKADNVSFVEIKPNSYVSINDYKIGPEVPLPILVDELINEIKEGTAQDEIRVSSFINGMIYIIGADPEFKFCNRYKEILYSYDEKIEEYILYIGLKQVNENRLEEGVVWLRALYYMNNKNLMGTYNYGLALEEKARRLLSLKNEKLGTVFFNASTRIIEKALNIDSNFDLAYYKLGYHYKNSSQFVKSKLTWEKYLQLGNDNELLDEVRENLESMQDDVIYEEGYNDILSGNSRVGLEKLLPLKEKYVDWWNLLFIIGLGFRQLNMYQEAKSEFENVLDIVPDQVDALNELGLCLAFLGEYEEAITKLSRAIELKPKDYEIKCNRGMVYLQINDIENAENDIKAAYELNNTDEITIACKKELERIKNMA